MSAKDNFAQAMKELLNSEQDAAVMEQEEKKAPPSSFSSFSQPDLRPPRAPAPERREPQRSASAPEPRSAPAPQAEQPVAAAAAPAAQRRGASSPAIEEKIAQAESFDVYVGQDNTALEGAQGVTYIAPGTVVVGDINTTSDLQVLGEVKGNLKVATKLELHGKVIGDVEADEAAITGSLIRGNLTVQNLVTIDADTTIVGDVSARNAEINGKVKGNLTVDERGHFKTNATLVGNLISGTVIIDEGAMLKGDIAITNAQYEDISVEEPEFDIEID